MSHVENQAVAKKLIQFRLILILASLICLCFTSTVRAQWQGVDLEWTLKRDRNGIQVFLSKVPDSKFRAVLSVIKLEASTQQLAALVMDLDNCPNWAAMCKSAEIIERISPTESYVYSINDAPFPVRDRDVVAHVKWFYDKPSGRVIMRSDAISDRLPERKGLVRVHQASSEWHFTPQADGMVLVENYAHIDPNGKLPAWIINLLIEDSPYQTLSNMRKLVLEGAYSNAEVAFIPIRANVAELKIN